MENKCITYCSFADRSGFLGALFLPGYLDPVAASKTAWAMSLNPGGEMKSLVAETVHEEELELIREYMGRLLTKEEVYEFDRKMADLLRELEPNGNW